MMDTNKRDDQEVVQGQGRDPEVKNFKRLKLVRETIRVSTRLRAGSGCEDTYNSKPHTL
jgi:hypothetical protein